MVEENVIRAGEKESKMTYRLARFMANVVEIVVPFFAGKDSTEFVDVFMKLENKINFVYPRQR